MSKEAQSHELTYDLIKRAVHGDQEAIEAYLRYYDAYINSLVMYDEVGPDSQIHSYIDEENLSRIPAEIREAQNLPLLLETAVELARRKAVVEPSIVVPQGYQGRVQYLLPICLTDMEQPDLAMTLTIMDGYYLGNTCLTLEMAYLNARLLSRPVAHWLTDIVEE